MAHKEKYVGVCQSKLRACFLQVLQIPEQPFCGHKNSQGRGWLTADLVYKQRQFLFDKEPDMFFSCPLCFLRQASLCDVLAGLYMCVAKALLKNCDSPLFLSDCDSSNMGKMRPAASSEDTAHTRSL